MADRTKPFVGANSVVERFIDMGDGTWARRVVAVDGDARDSGGSVLPAGFGNLPQTLVYTSGLLTSVAVTNGVSAWTQTLTYTNGSLSGISAWVKS